MARKKPWSFSAGSRPHTVTVFERTAGGPLWVRVWDPTLQGGKGGRRRLSLKHRNRERAKSYAFAQAALLREGEDEPPEGIQEARRHIIRFQDLLGEEMRLGRGGNEIGIAAGAPV